MSARPAAEPPAPGRLEVGRVARPHGIRGEVVVAAVSNRPERFAPGSVLRWGDRPLVVVAGRRHQGRWLVRFEGVDDRNTAETLRDATLTADALGALPEGEFWIHEVIGSTVRRPGGEVVGRVSSVEANPAHDLLVLDDGRLVPMVFVTELGPGTVVVDPPPGLLD